MPVMMRSLPHVAVEVEPLLREARPLVAAQKEQSFADIRWAVRRLAALYAEDTIDVDVIEAELAEAPADERAPGGTEVVGGDGGEGESLSGAVERTLKRFFSAHGDGLPPNGLYDRVLAEVERPLIELCLEATKGNQIKAAELLGLNRNTLRKKIRELDIQVVRGGRTG